MEELERGRKTIWMLFGILVLVLIIINLTYSVAIYVNGGSNENKVKSGTIKFMYVENVNGGSGINITDALPVSDIVGRSSNLDSHVFDFEIESNITGSNSIPYEITARKNSKSTLSEDMVKLYLTDMSENADSALMEPTYFSELKDSETVDNKDIKEKVLYEKVILPTQNNYVKKFRLRMWVAEEDKNNNPVNLEEITGQTFSVSINVYANTKVVSDEIKDFRSNTEIMNVYVDDAQVTQRSAGKYNYEFNVYDKVSKANLKIETVNPNSEIEINRVNQIEVSETNPLSTNKEIELVSGDNIYNIRVISENKSETKDYLINIKVN